MGATSADCAPWARKHGRVRNHLVPGAAGNAHRSEASGHANPAARPADLFPPALVRLLDTARQVIDQHVNSYGDCADCGSVWPCHSAKLAESALAAL